MVTEQQKTSTPMQDWVAQALDRMQPLLDGKVIVGVLAEDWKQEAAHAMMEDIEWLAMHFKVMPEPCQCMFSEEQVLAMVDAAYRAGGIASLNSVVIRMESKPKDTPWDVHPHEEDGI